MKVKDWMIREIRESLKALGYKEGTAVTIKPIDADHAEVSLSGEKFGIYDFVKHTFVD